MSFLSDSPINLDKINLSELNDDDIWNVIYSYFKDDKKGRNYYLTNHYIIGCIYLKSLKELNLKDFFMKKIIYYFFKK